MNNDSMKRMLLMFMLPVGIIGLFIFSVLFLWILIGMLAQGQNDHLLWLLMLGGLVLVVGGWGYSRYRKYKYWSQ